MAKRFTIDRYAADPKTWRLYAQFNLDSARILFRHEAALTLCFPAATLGHHAVEALLKTALIRKGLTIFDPIKLKQLDPLTPLTKDQCAWGHSLLDLAKQLESVRPDFDLKSELDGFFFPREMPMTIAAGLEVFNPFFWELRYPQQLDKLDSIGPDDVVLLDAIVAVLEPFAGTL